MPRLTATLLLSILPALVAAQAPQDRGPGRFPCTIVNGDGTFSPNQIACSDSDLIAPGDNDPNAFTQGDQPSPVGSQCVLAPEFGTYFCGWAGAACTSDANCDNGICAGGTCQGAFSQGCAGDDNNCLGYLYCTDAQAYPTVSNTCGGIGSFCQDARAADPFGDPAVAQATYNSYCASGYCNFGTGMCAVAGQLGDDCSSDPQFGCANGLVCDLQQGVCTAFGPAEPTPPATTTTSTGPTSTPFTASGAVTTTRVIAAPVSVTCSNSAVANSCRDGAARARSCCTAGTTVCQEIYNANLANCNSVAAGYYPCTSTSAADMEECCSSVFTAYFGAGTNSGNACAA